MNKYDWDKEKIEQAVKESNTYCDVLRKLNIPVAGNNASTLKKYIEKYKISTQHFTFHAKELGPKKDIKEYLVKNSTVKASQLKKSLFRSGLKENKCEICGAEMWLGKRLICQLHHINGDNTDNRLENLQILCPNCHSQTDNYCGQANISEKKKYYCADCGREIKTKAANYCLSCAMKRRKKYILSKEELLKILKECGNRNKAAKKLGVSEACIRKWCKNLGLPKEAKELKKLL